jgi:hypothetical protein
MGPLRALANVNVAVIVVHHHGHDADRPRGASAIQGFADMILNMARKTLATATIIAGGSALKGAPAIAYPA